MLNVSPASFFDVVGQYEVLLSVQHFVYECARVYEREREKVCVRKREGERVCVCACVCVCDRKKVRRKEDVNTLEANHPRVVSTSIPTQHVFLEILDNLSVSILPDCLSPLPIAPTRTARRRSIGQK